jgi:hypothetical protein
MTVNCASFAACCLLLCATMSAGFIVSEIFSEQEYFKHGVTLKQGVSACLGGGEGGHVHACQYFWPVTAAKCMNTACCTTQ